MNEQSDDKLKIVGGNQDSYSHYTSDGEGNAIVVVNNTNANNIGNDVDETSIKKNYHPSPLVYLATLCAHMASITLGATYGWTAPAMEELSSESSSVKTSETDRRFIASILTIGALFGALFCGFFIDRLGRRRTLMALGLPYGIGWLMIGLAKSATIIMIGRFITGLGIGIAIATVPTYLTEISTPKIRGHVGMTLNFAVVFGMVYMDLIYIGNFHWNELAIWALLPVFLLILTMYFMPESPVWCLNYFDKDPIGSVQMAKDHLRRLRSPQSDLNGEMHDLLEHRRQIEISNKNQISWSLSSLKRPDIYKPLLIGMAMLFFQQFCGINAIQFYMNDIFKTSGSNLQPKISTLITNGFMLLATVIGGTIIDRFGRRILLFVSAFGMMISIGILGIYYYQNEDLGNIHTDTTTTTNGNNFLPLFCLSIFVSSFSLGVGPIAWIFVTEITPPQTVALITTTTSTFAWIFTFLVVNQTPTLFKTLNQYGTYWFFSFISFTCMIFVWLFLPETKEKSIEEIGKIFKY